MAGAVTMSLLQCDARKDTAGTVDFFECRAWVNFNGTGTVAINAAGNVGSITDNGIGDYTINFTNAMPDANYSWTYGIVAAAALGDTSVRAAQAYNDAVPSASSLRIQTHYANSSAQGIQDVLGLNIAVFR